MTTHTFDVSKYEELWEIGTAFSRHSQSLKQDKNIKGYLLVVDYGGDIGVLTESDGTISSWPSPESKEVM